MFDETAEVQPPKLTHLGTYAVTQEEQNVRHEREKQGQHRRTMGDDNSYSKHSDIC